MGLLAATIITAIAVGFLAGLLTFKRSLRWCRHCGQTLSCADCSGRPTTVHPTAVGRAAPRAARRQA
jgi:hypothetical protein